MQEILPTFSEILGLQNFLKKSGLLKTTFCVEGRDDVLLFFRDLCDPGHFDEHYLGDFARKLKSERSPPVCWGVHLRHPNVAFYICGTIEMRII